MWTEKVLNFIIKKVQVYLKKGGVLNSISKVYRTREEVLIGLTLEIMAT